MGVTKQAAQQRSVSKLPAVTLDPDDGFSRFTPRARNVVVAAHDEARSGRHDHVTPAHLVLGLLAEPDAVAAQVLTGAGGVGGRHAQRGPSPRSPASESPPEVVPYDAQAAKALQLTFREALPSDTTTSAPSTSSSGCSSWRPATGCCRASGCRSRPIETAVVAALLQR